MLDSQLYLVNGVVALLAAAIPIYLTIRLNNNLRKLTTILSIFIIMHAAYCWLNYFGFDFLSEGVFEPLSAAVLMFFGISYYEIAKQEKLSIKKMVVFCGLVALLFIFLGTIILLLASLSIFVWLAARSKDIRSFQFQISIFIIIWIL
jgi:chromate transport protein ChrA